MPRWRSPRRSIFWLLSSCVFAASCADAKVARATTAKASVITEENLLFNDIWVPLDIWSSAFAFVYYDACFPGLAETISATLVKKCKNWGSQVGAVNRR